MKLIHKYDPKTKLFTGDELLEADSSSDLSAPPTYTLPANSTDVQPVGFHTPKWNGTAWVEAGDPLVVKQLKDTVAYNTRNSKVLEQIATLEASIDKPRMRREYAEGMRKTIAGTSPTAAEKWTIKKVQDVDNQIGVLRAKLK